jgi:hypothetical protein
MIVLQIYRPRKQKRRSGGGASGISTKETKSLHDSKWRKRNDKRGGAFDLVSLVQFSQIYFE